MEEPAPDLLQVEPRKLVIQKLPHAVEVRLVEVLVHFDEAVDYRAVLCNHDHHKAAGP
jgi:hypothetical protein